MLNRISAAESRARARHNSARAWAERTFVPFMLYNSEKKTLDLKLEKIEGSVERTEGAVERIFFHHFGKLPDAPGSRTSGDKSS